MTVHNQFLLLKDRRFAPLFTTQFLGAFHDNLFKNALVVLLLFGAAARDPQHAEILTTLAAGVFILPFVLFSAFAGQLADRYAKDKIIRIIKLCEIGIALLGAVSLIGGSTALSFLTLFALGVHSACFGPSKYSILPQHLQKDELIGGNALLNTGTFLAILAGTITGTSLSAMPHGTLIVGCGLIVVACTGYLSSRMIPPAPAVATDTALDFNPFTETGKVIAYTFKRGRDIVLSILGISWFFFMGGMFMAQLPNFVRDTLQAGPHTLAVLLVLFSVGIAFGGLLNNRLLRGKIEAVFVPLAALGMTLFSFDLYAASKNVDGLTLRIAFDLTAIAINGGLFVVPLNALIQDRTDPAHRARVMAGNAIMNALFMVASAIISAALIAAGFGVRDLFLTFAIANGLVALYICRLLPDYLLKSILKLVLKTLYQVDVRGLDNIEKAGPRAVIVGNHVSLLDAPLLAAFLPGRPMFAVNSYVSRWWWVAPFLRMVDAFPLDPTNPLSLKSLIRKVEENRHVVIFPEGRLTETGALMKVYDGPGMIADKSGAMILPVRLDGVQHTPFARLKGKVPLKNFPKITITILPPRQFKLDDSLTGRERRAQAGQQLYTLMEDMMFLTADREQTLFEALLKARYVNGAKAVVVEDVMRQPMVYRDLVRNALALGHNIKGFTALGEAVGLLLPNSNAAVTTFFALQAYGRVPAMLNFSTGHKAMLSACKTAAVKTVLTSRKFVDTARLHDVIAQLETATRIVYLEDVKSNLTLADKLTALSPWPERIHKRQSVSPHDKAVVLFTSGSEGEPKGVVLCHANLMSNILQLAARVDFNRQDILFNCLPMFHSFGLTGGTLLPVLSGVKTFLYPSPLHYRIVPEMIYSANATIMFGTDTFLQGYGRMADPYDFYRMRYIFAGAEKVKDETRKLYRDKFGVPVLEGYGATESAPAIAVNSIMQRKDGTVGRILPGIDYKLEDVPGVHDGGRLFVRGPNVMLGYYKADAPGVLQPPEDGWHDTGDIVAIDADGFVTIKGRAKRFAKIGGEMISLAQVEHMADTVWPGFQHAAFSIPDPRKGEQLVLLTTKKDASRDALSQYAAKSGIPALAVPATLQVIDKMPLLATGKTDYGAATSLIRS
jgi:acyl-[acyl-carrier-protein]-phospholipid O-acyltransferase/long-chain-fatty-acid--[acyl-carrier-protein] ligase